MLEGLTDDEVDQYLNEHPFEVNVAEAVTPHVYRGKESEEPDQEAIRELRQAQESLEWEMTISQRVKASQLEEVDLGTEKNLDPLT